jgi:hypothetical protein
MSTDGMTEMKPDESCHTHHTNETEEEYAVLDRGDDYKLSIMRKKRPPIKITDEETKDQNTDQSSLPHFPKFAET